ncbi:hypothetical protein OO013_16245 [Mangrovivirga sp. M17]|uniref:Uncharacterized protein n=1 Tax=Mangrovivirga halotolerans TaxID=2993936 RepID=A0ABT3RV74_9BACT|nr:hypothetical protein [Mangrovivirga halotolerans]MCX2745431.1 hypothetical protein [Mangrovivirga halotolerans]
MKTTLLIFSFFVTLHCFGQSDERQWEEGKLTWNDFKGEPFESSPSASELSYQLSYSTTKKRIGDTTFFFFQTRNYINPYISWVKESEKSDQLLRYNQVIFNILELHRRELQEELHRINNTDLAENKFRTQYQKCNYEIKQFQHETNSGTDKSALVYWDKKITQKLKDNPFELIPEVSDRNFGYGINAGFGTGIMTGSISDFFSPTFNFVFGFDIAYKNTTLFLNGTLAGNRVKRDYTEDGFLWTKDLKTNVAIIDVSIGQTLIENSTHKLTPFAGLGILEFSVANNEGEAYEDHRIVNYGLIYGLNYDFKFRHAIRLTPSPFGAKYKERAEHNIRVRLYATSSEYENMKGTSINLTVGYALFGRIIKIK